MLTLRTLHRPLSVRLHTMMPCADIAMTATLSWSIVYVVPPMNKEKPLTPALSRWERELCSAHAMRHVYSKPGAK